ncbi:CMRF35-like molecule 9 [Hoplias malabaricus]|uniref:CMRF35-like molecule 9 n=1 Tax=Hoplias malabaricus TaxID=27720 RepID=UPI003461BEAE
MKILFMFTFLKITDAWSTELLNSFVGENVTISCTYPEEFKNYDKCFTKRDDDSFTEVVSTTNPHIRRFSISEDRSSNMFLVTIRNVTTEDSGDYLCSVLKGDGYSTFRRIHLNLLERPRSTVKPTTEASKNTSAEFIPRTSDENHCSSSIISTVFVCVTLLLVGGLSLIFYHLKHPNTRDSSSNNQRQRDITAEGDKENNSPRNQSNFSMDPADQSLHVNTDQSDSVYQILDPNTDQSYSIYQDIDFFSNQSGSVYQSIDLNTRQSDSVYLSLNAHTNQQDSIYQDIDL